MGKWGGFTENYTKMTFTGGQACWNGPARSLTVKLGCGNTETVTKVEEPSRCEYVAELTTPAMCSPHYVQDIIAKASQMGLGHDELR